LFISTETHLILFFKFFMILGIIPARSNSKRILNKNIKNFYGKPIISYAIKSAINSKIFDKIVVSTDSEKIGLIAQKYGAEYLFKRPKRLSGDHIWPSQVVDHAISWIEEKFVKPKLICCIYPTTPLLLPSDIIDSYKMIKNSKFYYVFSAVKNSYPIQRSFCLDSNKNIRMINKKFFYKRSQDLKETYHDAGQFYWGTYDAWTKKKIIFGGNSKIYLMPQLRSQDIDTTDDWHIAEKLFRLLD
jgi:pseudaminic acid cytidylyltransferase